MRKIIIIIIIAVMCLWQMNNIYADEHGSEEAIPEDVVEPADPIQPSAESYNAYGYEVLEDGTSAIVSDFQQLKDAIEKDNGITTVYLGADITLEKNRTLIPSSKVEFTLSGRDPKTGIKHTITEYQDGGLANIVVAGGNLSTRMAVIDDIIIVNRGIYYGLIGIEGSGRSVDLVFRDVEYAGRQLAYNPYGTLILEGNNKIDILAVTSGQAGQEVAEVLNVIVRGKTEITSEATFPVFHMEYGKSSFTVEGDLGIRASKLASDSGIIRSSSGEQAVEVKLAAGARMYVQASSRFFSSIWIPAGSR